MSLRSESREHHTQSVRSFSTICCIVDPTLKISAASEILPFLQPLSRRIQLSRNIVVCLGAKCNKAWDLSSRSGTLSADDVNDGLRRLCRVTGLFTVRC